MENKPIQITEQDVHFLVEDTVRRYLKENGMEEGIWGGLKNVWQGVKQGNLNVGQTYKSGNLASNFQGYAEQAMKAIQGMSQIANQTGNQQIQKYLSQVSAILGNTVTFYNNVAQRVANGQMSNNYSKGGNIFKANNKSLNKMGYNQQVQQPQQKKVQKPQQQAQQQQPQQQVQQQQGNPEGKTPLQYLRGESKELKKVIK